MKINISIWAMHIFLYDNEFIIVILFAGSIFIHQHNLLQQVKPVTAGSKHVVRLDVLYDTCKRDILSEMYD